MLVISNQPASDFRLSMVLEHICQRNLGLELKCGGLIPALGPMGPITTLQNTGNDGGKECAFPFTFEMKSYNECIYECSDGMDKLWCSTSSDYDSDMKWGLCPSDARWRPRPGYESCGNDYGKCSYCLGIECF